MPLWYRMSLAEHRIHLVNLRRKEGGKEGARDWLNLEIAVPSTHVTFLASDRSTTLSGLQSLPTWQQDTS